MEKASLIEARNGKDDYKYITPYTLANAGSKFNYRIGDVIISTNSENPSVVYGGTWELLCPGRTLVCINTADTSFNTVKQIGGHKELQSHYHTYSGETSLSGWHEHQVALNGDSGFNIYYRLNWGGNNTGYCITGNNVNGQSSGASFPSIAKGSGNHTHTYSGSTSAVGNGNAGNLQPFMVVYVWEKKS